jgi:hypothetical protein
MAGISPHSPWSERKPVTVDALGGRDETETTHSHSGGRFGQTVEVVPVIANKKIRRKVKK